MSARVALGGTALVALLPFGASWSTSESVAHEAARSARGAPSEIGVVVPARIDGPIAITTRSGLSFSYRLDAATPALVATSPSVTVKRRGDVVEDFVELRTRPSEERLRYVIDVSSVAGVRRVGDVVELLDARGAPWARMAPPTVATRSGEVKPLRVTLSGCAYDTSPAPPWDRAIVAPGAKDCVLDVSWRLREDEYPAVVDPAWVVGPSMVGARTFHQAARLPNGRVLVVGGVDGPGPGSEIYDPATNTWATTSSLFGAVILFRATALTDGRVLAVGGSDFPLNTRYATVGTYDPSTGEWTTEPPLPFGLSGHALTALPGGRALVTGGFVDLDVTTYAAIFERGKGFTAVAPMLERRGHHTATLLPTGKVLVSGGERCCTTMAFEPLSSSEIYDPASNAWSSGPSLKIARYDHTASLLPGGRVLVVGGSTRLFEEGFVGSAEVIDANLTRFAEIGALQAQRSFHQATVLSNGKVLFTGSAGRGFAASTLVLAETFDPRGDRFGVAGDTIEPRAMHAATALLDGRVLLTGGGGRIEVHSRTTELFGTRLGDPCDADGCPNGFCVSGVCCATETGCVGDAGVDASIDGSVDDAADAGDTGASSPVPPAEAATTSYHACALAHRVLTPSSRDSRDSVGAGAAVLALLLLGGSRRAGTRRARRAGR